MLIDIVGWCWSICAVVKFAVGAVCPGGQGALAGEKLMVEVGSYCERRSESRCRGTIAAILLL